MICYLSQKVHKQNGRWLINHSLTLCAYLVKWLGSRDRIRAL